MIERFVVRILVVQYWICLAEMLEQIDAIDRMPAKRPRGKAVEAGSRGSWFKSSFVQ